MIEASPHLAIPRMNQFLQQATEKRESLINSDTNCFRLMNGYTDGHGGVFVESYADRLAVATLGGEIPTGLKEELRSTGKTVYWKRLDQQEKTAPTHLFGPPQETPFPILENGVTYEANFQSGYSQGIFLDQRLNRAEVRRRAQPQQRILNTFAYTGAFSVCAALGGATTTTLDLSRPYLDWGKRNFEQNKLNLDEHYFCKGDTFHWLKRFAKQGRTFDGIILDPPTFSRDDKGKIFRVEVNYDSLVKLASACLAPGGWILACTNCRRLSLEDFETLLLKGADRSMKLHHAAMPLDFAGDDYLKSVWIEY